MRAYIAGPLFNEGERWFDEQIDAIAQTAGLETFLPHRDGKEMGGLEKGIRHVFENNVASIDRADLVIANLNGVTTDDGTAWEIGYAYGRGKPIIGVYTDMRLTFHQQVVNLMIECACYRLVRSLDELDAAVKAFVAANP